MTVEITLGFAALERAQIGQMFWDGFQTKLRLPLGSQPQALRVIVPNLQSDYALCAHTADGALVGFAGIKDQAGGLMAAGQSDLDQIYGRFGGLWRGWVLNQFEHAVAPGALYLDGIFVAPEFRRQGVASDLLQALETLAESLGNKRISLRVVDTNAGAMALYQRHGYQVVGQTKAGLLRPVLGYKSYSTLQKAVSRTCL